MFEFLSNNNLLGLAIGLCTFLVIGLFHPLVIKGEYYFSVKIWWAFLALGIVCCIGAYLADDLFWSIMLGVAGFSSFWGIGEVFEQEKRVQKGWFPRNTKRKYPFDSNENTSKK